MKIVYTLSHPGDQLNSERAGHIVRANAILRGLESLGHEIIRLEAATEQRTKVAVATYRGILRKALPKPVALRLRDAARVAHGRHHGARLAELIRQHQPDLILETYLAFSLAGKLASEATAVPLVIDDIPPPWEEEQQYGVGLKGTARRIYREAINQATLLIAVNRTIKAVLEAEGQRGERIAVVENGIDERMFHPSVDGRHVRARYNIQDDEVVFAFVGSFQPYHRVDMLLSAFGGITTSRPTRLLIIGDGKLKPAAEALCEKLGIGDRTTFTGQIPYDQVASYSAAGDICVMPATNEYGNPMKVYEYMALGKAVLAPDQDTIREVVSCDTDAYLFEPNSISALTQAMRALVDNAELRKRLGGQAAKTASAYTWRSRAQVMDAAIRKAVL